MALLGVKGLNLDTTHSIVLSNFHRLFVKILRLINGIHPESSSHLNVVFTEVLHPIELEFGDVGF